MIPPTSPILALSHGEIINDVAEAFNEVRAHLNWQWACRQVAGLETWPFGETICLPEPFDLDIRTNLWQAWG